MKTLIRSSVAAACCAMLVLAASPAFAQRGGGRGFGGPNRVQLCSLAPVQTELKLTDDQKKLATELFEKYSAESRELLQNAGGDFAAAMEKRTKLSNEMTAKLVEKLDDAQKSRLTQIFVQYGGTNSLADADVQKALKITDDQAKKLTEARAANREAAMSALGDLQGASQEERTKKMTELQKSADEKLFACISADQKSEFEKMGGAKIELDLSSLFPRRPNN